MPPRGGGAAAAARRAAQTSALPKVSARRSVPCEMFPPPPTTKASSHQRHHRKRPQLCAVCWRRPLASPWPNHYSPAVSVVPLCSLTPVHHLAPPATHSRTACRRPSAAPALAPTRRTGDFCSPHPCSHPRSCTRGALACRAVQIVNLKQKQKQKRLPPQPPLRQDDQPRIRPKPLDRTCGHPRARPPTPIAKGRGCYVAVPEGGSSLF